jgi:riboflavin synthase
MFTGLVEVLGAVRRANANGAGKDFVISASIAQNLAAGDSIAVNGVCLTVIERDEETFRVQAGPETLERTNLGELRADDVVNLERALQIGDRLGGHLVQGHVDGVGRIAGRNPQGEWDLVRFTCAPGLTAQMAPKGSIAVDGVSLTLVDVTADGFSIALIPHTLTYTTLGRKEVGQTVNLETDLLAKYVEKQLRLAGVLSR